jgi:hypothetical protein
MFPNSNPEILQKQTPLVTTGDLPGRDKGHEDFIDPKDPTNKRQVGYNRGHHISICRGEYAIGSEIVACRMQTCPMGRTTTRPAL